MNTKPDGVSVMSAELNHASGVWDEDPMYELAVNLMREAPEYACISRIQRKLTIGYNRASRIMDAMIERGVIARTSSAEDGVVYTVLAEPSVALEDGKWYMVRYEGLGEAYEAPALYRDSAKAFYSVEFSGIPTREVEVLKVV